MHRRCSQEKPEILNGKNRHTRSKARHSRLTYKGLYCKVHVKIYDIIGGLESVLIISPKFLLHRACCMEEINLVLLNEAVKDHGASIEAQQHYHILGPIISCSGYFNHHILRFALSALHCPASPSDSWLNAR